MYLEYTVCSHSQTQYMTHDQNAKAQACITFYNLKQKKMQYRFTPGDTFEC